MTDWVNDTINKSQETQQAQGGQDNRQINWVTDSISPQIPADSNWEDFQVAAKQISKDRGFPSNVLLGQAALESARGSSQMARDKNNYFGYMAYDSDPNMARNYQSPVQSINDYIDLITQDPIYRQAWSQYLQDHSSINLIKNIKGAGYATDPNYVAKVMATPEFMEGLQ